MLSTYGKKTIFEKKGGTNSPKNFNQLGKNPAYNSIQTLKNKLYINIIMSIEPCPKCKKASGWTWTWGQNNGHSEGFSTCKGCGVKY